MGAVKQDGTPVPNGWNRMPAPIVEPLINYYLACGDQEALEFAKAYAEGIMTGAQPDGIKIKADGDIDNGHSHTTMHALWGIAHLGVVTGDERYTAFAKRSWDFMLSRGTGAGWFPAMPGGYSTDETCLTSDMMSNAAMIARGGHPEYFDYVERYLRNRISPCQFVVTPEFEAEYKTVNQQAGEEKIRQGLDDVQDTSGRHPKLLRPERLGKQHLEGHLSRHGRMLRAGRAAGDLYHLEQRHRPLSRLEARTCRSVCEHEFQSGLEMGTGRVVHAGRRASDREGRRARHFLPPPSALGPARPSHGLCRIAKPSPCSGPATMSGSRTSRSATN